MAPRISLILASLGLLLAVVSIVLPGVSERSEFQVAALEVEDLSPCPGCPSEGLERMCLAKICAAIGGPQMGLLRVEQVRLEDLRPARKLDVKGGIRGPEPPPPRNVIQEI